MGGFGLHLQSRHSDVPASARQRLSLAPLALSTLAACAVLLTASPAQAQSGAATSGSNAPTAADTRSDAMPRLGVDAARPRAFAGFSASFSALRDSLVSRARESIGIRYIFGGTDPLRGLDCSALIGHVLSAFDISLPRTAAEQARMGRAIPKDRTQMKPGDLLTFGKGSRVTHIGMYVGEGRFVHASTSRKQVIESTLDQKRSSLVKQWLGVRRVIDTQYVSSRYDSVFALLDSVRAADSLFVRTPDTSRTPEPALTRDSARALRR